MTVTGDVRRHGADPRGLSGPLQVNAGRDGIVVSGVDERGAAFARPLTLRAARVAWFRLTQYLYPERSASVTALVTTTRLQPQDTPGVTNHVDVTGLGAGRCQWVGRGPGGHWQLTLTDSEAFALWRALDLALFPSGWRVPPEAEAG